MTLKPTGPTEYKTVPAFVILPDRKGEEPDTGVVKHLISVYGVEDLGQDVSHPGMFTKTITERKDVIRVLDNHRRTSVNCVIGKPLDLYEVQRSELPPQVLKLYPDATGGLMADTQFLLDTPEGLGAYQRIKAGAVTEFSFAYDPLDIEIERKENGRRIRHLRTVRLWEYGPVIFGMNPAAMAISAKGVDEEGEESDVEVTAELISVVLLPEGDFVEGSLKRISFGRDADAVIGTLKGGEETSSVQTMFFDRKAWSVEDARKWAPELSKEVGYFQKIGAISSTFREKYSYYREDDGRLFSVVDVFDGFLVAQPRNSVKFYRVDYSFNADGEVDFADEAAWVEGSLEFVPTPVSVSEEDVSQEVASMNLDLTLKMVEIELAND